MTSPIIRIRSDSKSPFTEYALQLISLLCGIRFQLIRSDNPDQPAEIYHGNDGNQSCTLRIPIKKRYSIDDIPDEPDKNDYEKAMSKAVPFPFDLFSAIRFWITDEANSDSSVTSFDTHQRLKASSSAQEVKGILDVPIVNHYLILFREWLRIRFKIETSSILPAGKKCGIVLSHDVDSPVNYGDPTHALWIAQKWLRKGRIKPALINLKEAGMETARRFKRPGQRWWLFREIMKLESIHGFRSVFFFATRSRYHKDANPLDVWYDITAPCFKRIFSEITGNGFEIGLHASYNSHEQFSHIAEERNVLEELCGQQVLGNRHHFWRMKRPCWDTLEDHAKSGLHYDSSIGFNDGFGYRLGIGLPFYPWNPGTNSVIGVMQIPVLAMDGVFLKYEEDSIDAALMRLSQLIDKLKASEGIAALDWHVRNSYPGSVMTDFLGNLYLEILEILSADPEISVLDCRTLYEDITRRLAT